MTEAQAIVDYVHLRAEYDAAHRRLDGMAEIIAATAEALHADLEGGLSPTLRWPSLDSLAAAQAELRRLRGEMDLKWREIPRPLAAALRPPPDGAARRLPRG